MLKNLITLLNHIKREVRFCADQEERLILDLMREKVSQRINTERRKMVDQEHKV